MRCALASETDFDGWRDQARRALQQGVPPEAMEWISPEGSPSLLPPPDEKGEMIASPKVPKSFLQMAERAVCHRDPDRFARLYSLLYRLQAEPGLLEDASDGEVSWLISVDKAIRRDVHKMHAFVRFRKVGERLMADGSEREIFTAWFEPQHRIVRLGIPWFHRRFVGMDWSILTPDGCAHWNGEQLSFAPGVSKDQAPDEDCLEEAWQTYFANIFNPGRLKIGAMMSEMPKLYWDNLPEAEIIPELVRSATEREQALIAKAPTRPNIRAGRIRVAAQHLDHDAHADPAKATDLAELAAMARFCQRCDLAECATQTVFGEGPVEARLMLVGEQPGDQEDLAGRPFVGPAGQVLEECLKEAGIDRQAIYVTNAVKHFRYQLRGHRRIHERPLARHNKACSIWLEQEQRLVQPQLILSLGVTALQALTGRSLTLGSVRGTLLETDHTPLLPTIHPSYLLRLPDRAEAQRARAAFIDDLRRAQCLSQADVAA